MGILDFSSPILYSVGCSITLESDQPVRRLLEHFLLSQAKNQPDESFFYMDYVLSSRLNQFTTIIAATRFQLSP